MNIAFDRMSLIIYEASVMAKRVLWDQITLTIGNGDPMHEVCTRGLKKSTCINLIVVRSTLSLMSYWPKIANVSVIFTKVLHMSNDSRQNVNILPKQKLQWSP